MAATIKIIIGSEGGTDTIKRDLSDIGDTAKKSGGGFSALKEVAIGALRAVGAGVVDLAVKGGQALAGFVSDSISAAGNFEAGMNQFAAAAGDSLEGAGLKVDDFKNLFLQLGKDLPVSTKEVQDAAIALIKGGLDPAVVAGGALESSLKFAAAAGMDLAAAAELGIKQLGTFVPMSASAAEQTAFLAEAQNLLVKAAGASTLDVDKLGDAMLAAGGSAKASGVEYQDFVTTMGLISPQFSSAAEAGTSYKNFLTRLIPATQNAKDTMIALGLATKDGKSLFYDAEGAFIGNANAAELLKQKLGPLTAEQRAEAVAVLFGNDAKNAALALMDAGSAGYDLFAQKMAAANGVQAQAEATQQGYNFAMENFKGTVEALQISVGTMLLPVLGQLVGMANTGVGAVLGFAQALGGNQEAMAALSPTGQALITTVQTLAASLQSQAGPAVASLSALWTGTLQPALQTVWGVFQTQIIPILQNIAMTVLPILGSALQVAAGFFTSVLIPAAQMLWSMFTTLLLPVLASAAVWLRDNLPPAVQALADFLTGTLFPALGKVYDFINANVVPILEAVGRVLAAVVGKAVEALAALWENILLPALQKAGAWIKDNLGPILERFGAWLGDVTGGVQGISDAIKGLIKWLGDMADAISNISLPDWLTPGSPTPFEIAMRGLADAFKTELNPQIGDMAAQLTMLPAYAPTGGGNTTSTSTVNNLTFAPNYSGTPRERMDYALARSLAGV